MYSSYLIEREKGRREGRRGEEGGGEGRRERRGEGARNKTR